MNTENKLANIGVDVDVDLTIQSAVYLLAVIVIGSIAYFLAKKYI